MYKYIVFTCIYCIPVDFARKQELENVLARTLTLAEEKAKLDAACKRLLVNKIILAWIMKHSMEEYRNCSIEDIAEKYIEGTPQVATQPIHRDEEARDILWRSADIIPVWYRFCGGRVR